MSIISIGIDSWPFVRPDCHFDRGVRQLEFCCNWGDRMGLGWCRVALQHHLLHPARSDKVLHSLHPEWTRMGSCYWAKGTNNMTWRNFFFLPLGFIMLSIWWRICDLSDCIHKAKGLREGTTWASMGTRAKNIARFATTRHQDVHRENSLHRSQ